MNKVQKKRLKRKKKPLSTHYHCFGVNNSRSHDPLRAAQWNTQWTTLSKRSLCNDFLWKRTTFLSTAVVNCDGKQRMKPLVCNTDSMFISFSAVSLYVWGTPTNRKSEILACVKKKPPQRSNLCSLKRSRSEKRVSVQCKITKRLSDLGAVNLSDLVPCDEDCGRRGARSIGDGGTLRGRLRSQKIGQCVSKSRVSPSNLPPRQMTSCPSWRGVERQ